MSTLNLHKSKFIDISSIFHFSLYVYCLTSRSFIPIANCLVVYLFSTYLGISFADSECPEAKNAYGLTLHSNIISPKPIPGISFHSS